MSWDCFISNRPLKFFSNGLKQPNGFDFKEFLSVAVLSSVGLIKKTKMNFRSISFIYQFISAITISIIIFSCEKKNFNQPVETILVNIDNRATISTDEFIRRAEYTVRPPYCKGNTYLHKKIILNSLIAEKLLALDVGDKNPLSESEQFQLFLKGRKEQAMRQWMYHQEATQRVRLDSSEIKQYYQFAGREYEIAYYAISDSSLLNRASEVFAQHHDAFEQFYQQAFGDTIIPKRKVIWHDAEHPAVLATLFSQNVLKGQVLQPIEIEKNNYLIIKVLGWSDIKAITDAQIQSRYQKISEQLTNLKASERWQKSVAQIMRGKTANFNEPVFWKLNQAFFELYFKTDEDKKTIIQERIWDNEQDMMKALDSKAIHEIMDQPFFTVAGKTWTVSDFRRELMSHPLVFRQRHMPANEFAQQFRLAVVDLIRDFYVTQEAYKNGYDKVNVVQRNEQMWRDAYLAIYQKNDYLKSVKERRSFDKNYMSIIGEHLNAYVDSLQQKYHKKVQLNFDEFERIALTSIDLYVTQKSQPYQVVVPRFPVLTTDHYIQYIARLKD